MTDFTFERAVPVWAKGRQTEMNVSLVFRAVVGSIPALLRISGHTNYMIFINGSFFSQGPARAGHGFFRADEFKLDSFLTKEKNVVAVLAAGYNVNSFYLTDQPSFLCAEIVSGSEILYATGTEKEFSCREFTERTKKVQRFSFQRPFTESYSLCPDSFDIFTDPELVFTGVSLEKTGEKRFITRDTPISDYEVRTAESIAGEGRMEPVCGEPKKYLDRSFTSVDGVYIKGFKKEELDVSAVEELYKLQSVFSSGRSERADALFLPKDGFAILDMGLNTTGFMAFDVETEGDTVIWAVFNEHLDKNGRLDPGFGGTASVVRYELKEKGFYRLVSFEPYTYRYLQLISMGGEAKITNARQYAEHYPAAGLTNLKTINVPDLWLI
ncbi:MAG: hypothetical protein IJS90_05005, partial [Clostridia bacterium]|nr:hypothetical protein [Clostridia bacterium]